MKIFLLMALLGAGLARPAGTIHSHLFIVSGKQFLLGGNQRGAFTVRGKNVGRVTVEIQEQPRTGPAVYRGTLAPGEQAQVAFADSSTAVLINRGGWRAVLDLDVTGDTGNLRMTYTPTGR
ncbi:MAG: hypothetical protein ACRYFX_24195 [Janthinobacterium lividum]